jgi:hypothetical protein
MIICLVVGPKHHKPTWKTQKEAGVILNIRSGWTGSALEIDITVLKICY